MITVEPPNKRHIGTSYFVLCKEVVFSSEVQNVLVLWESEHLGPKEVSFIESISIVSIIWKDYERSNCKLFLFWELFLSKFVYCCIYFIACLMIFILFFSLGLF